MIFDSHNHTKFSADSEMLAEDAIKRAESLNLGLVFTEHLDFDLPGNFIFNPTDYFDEYKKFRGDKVRLGAEVGMTKISRERNKKFVAENDFDMIIGSIHMLDGEDIYHKEFFDGKTKSETYKNFFTVTAEEAAVEDFDVLGHIDYICRAATYEDTSIDYPTFKNEIDEVLKIVVEREKVLELNTRRLSNPEVLKELEPVYRSYKNFGGRFVTIGSDAHRPDAVGGNFKVALDFVSALDLKPVTFSKRKIEVLS